LDLASYIKQIFDEAKVKYASDWQRPKVGWTCTYIPVEILEAASVIPVRIVPEPWAEKADAFLDPNFCPYVRACLGKALDGGYDELSGIIVANSCDAMRRLHDAWRYYCPRGFHFLLDVPRIVTQDAVEYLRAGLDDLFSSLQSHFGLDIGEEDLRQAVGELNRTRSLLGILLSWRRQGRVELSYADFLFILDKQWELPRQGYNYALERVIEAGPKAPTARANKPRVFITGSILDGRALIDLIEDLGATVAGVDSCMAERIVPQVDLGEDILGNLARSYLNKIPCARMKDSKKRAEYIIGKIRETGAEGLIYVGLKFCDPYLYEWPYLMEEMRVRRLPVLFLEGEYRGRMGGGIRTRVQAFLEMLGARKLVTEGATE